MSTLRPRHPILIGIVGVVVLALLATAAYNWDRLPIIGGGPTYTAEFRDAAGLRRDDPIYIAGVEVGRVSAVELAEDRVRVSLRVRTPGSVTRPTPQSRSRACWVRSR